MPEEEKAGTATVPAVADNKACPTTVSSKIPDSERHLQHDGPLIVEDSGSAAEGVQNMHIRP